MEGISLAESLLYPDYEEIAETFKNCSFKAKPTEQASVENIYQGRCSTLNRDLITLPTQNLDAHRFQLKLRHLVQQLTLLQQQCQTVPVSHSNLMSATIENKKQSDPISVRQFITRCNEVFHNSNSDELTTILYNLLKEAVELNSFLSGKPNELNSGIQYSRGKQRASESTLYIWYTDQLISQIRRIRTTLWIKSVKFNHELPSSYAGIVELLVNKLNPTGRQQAQTSMAYYASPSGQTKYTNQPNLPYACSSRSVRAGPDSGVVPLSSPQHARPAFLNSMRVNTLVVPTSFTNYGRNSPAFYNQSNFMIP